MFAYKLLPSWIPEMVVITWFVAAVLCITAILASRKLSVRNPSKFQSALEFIVVSLDGFVRNIVGDEAKTLTPIIGTIFIVILSLSLIGLVPGFMSPTASTNTTVSLALLAFLLVQYYAISRNGIINYFKHFLGEPIWLAPLMLPLHVIGELARPLSLSIRLFGNIFGEETVIAVFVLIVTSVLGNFLLPLQFPMMLFAIFGGFIQSLVFSMLVCIYIAVALQGHEEHH
ncbi:MAG: F0F1 ATP synthase subunit A [Armatimonadota bacterium]